jgi:hypothetical protein
LNWEVIDVILWRTVQLLLGDGLLWFFWQQPVSKLGFKDIS